jgi:hypothetical protein
MRWDEMPEIPFSDFGVKWFEDIIGKITGWFADELASGYEAIRDGIFGTPLPDGSGTSLVFGAPSQSDEPWHSIYEAVVAGEVMVFALLILQLQQRLRRAPDETLLVDWGGPHRRLVLGGPLASLPR